jgi:hypothetical protein
MNKLVNKMEVVGVEDPFQLVQVVKGAQRSMRQLTFYLGDSGIHFPSLDSAPLVFKSPSSLRVRSSSSASISEMDYTYLVYAGIIFLILYILRKTILAPRRHPAQIPSARRRPHPVSNRLTFFVVSTAMVCDRMNNLLSGKTRLYQRRIETIRWI